MRHGDKINNLGRTASHRKALMSNMACSLIEHKRIFTTLAKAKALRTYVEPIINRSKDDSTHSRRTVFSYLKSKEVVAMLFKDVSVKVAERNGGYTRIIKTGNRQGDAAEMALIELVDFNDIYSNGKAATTEKAKTTRRSRAKKTTDTKAEGTTEAKDGE
ncbi:MAG: 50S ribosomal protein L17 [Bacteroidia bacterium]|nr:50S ribosomal protein L17 [Bacteroidia bacterium]